MKKRVFKVVVILWMIVIFIFSARNADTSTEDSHHIGMVIGHVIHTDFDEWTPENQEAYAAAIDHPIRKTAHASEYLILGIFVLGSTPTSWSYRKRGIISWVISTGYACTDEFHQLFVPGRSGQITDVGIDGLGAAIGVLLSIIVISRIARREKM